MRACSSSRASCHPLMVTDPTLSVVFLATIFLLPSSLYRKGTAQINLSDAVEVVFETEQRPRSGNLLPLPLLGLFRNFPPGREQPALSSRDYMLLFHLSY